MHRCRSCHLYFRHPHLSKEDLDALYRQTAGDVWQYAASSRKDWDIGRKLIHKNFRSGKLLDIGCFDGSFLANVGGSFELFGIEINAAAAARAQAHNITIVGSDLTDLDAVTHKFEVVIAMDVIEHVVNPSGFLASMAGALVNGGILMISTGNTEAWSWKLMGSRYWYCSVPEHMSFINSKWCRSASEAASLAILETHYFRHDADAALCKRLVDFGKNLAYLVAPHTVARHRTGGAIRSLRRPSLPIPPMWLSATDHLMVVMQKK